MFKDFLRDLRKMRSGNDGTRTLFESVMVPEVKTALEDWRDNTNKDYVIIGGAALSYHVKPRYTEDVDVLYKSENEFPKSVIGFTKHRGHAYEHKKTGVEIELLDPEYLKIPKNIVEKIIDTSISSNGFQIASKEGLIVSKLFRFSRQDQADIESIYLHYKGKIDLSDFNLDQELLNKYESIVNTLT
jgi:hypothetical protein